MVLSLSPFGFAHLHWEVQSERLWHANCVMHVSAACLGLVAAFLQMIM